MKFAPFARVRLLRRALPIFLLILRKKPTVLQSIKLQKSFFIVVEIVSFLYATLMSTANAQSSNPTLPDGTINLVTDALCMLNFMATVDLNVLQVGGAVFRFALV